jgi:hypothetical protein
MSGFDFRQAQDEAQLGNDARFPALGLDVGHLVVGHSDEGFCFGIKRAGRNGKILVWQRIIAGFDPSRPSHLNLLIYFALPVASF